MEVGPDCLPPAIHCKNGALNIRRALRGQNGARGGTPARGAAPAR